MQTGTSFLIFSIVSTVFVTAALRARNASMRTSHRSFEMLIASLQPINLDGVSCIAQDFLLPHQGQLSMEPEVMWQMLGGKIGLRRMRTNADLLLAMAIYAAEWNDEEGILIAERMRRDALRLHSTLNQIRLGMVWQRITGLYSVRLPFQLQEAASSYLMRQRLLALYESSHAALLPRLAEAV